MRAVLLLLLGLGASFLKWLRRRSVYGALLGGAVWYINLRAWEGFTLAVVAYAIIELERIRGRE